MHSLYECICLLDTVKEREARVCVANYECKRENAGECVFVWLGMSERAIELCV